LKGANSEGEILYDEVVWQADKLRASTARDKNRKQTERDQRDIETNKSILDGQIFHQL
jgi:hypothetical protein